MFLVITCVALDVLREILFKTAATPQPLFPSAIGWGASGVMIWALEIVLWSWVLARMPLNVAFPIMSLTYAATPLAGKLVFGENISHRRWTGIALVTLGAMIVGSTGQM